MIHTIKPDGRGRVSLLPLLKLVGWEPGYAVEIDLIKAVKIKSEKKKSGDESGKPL
ncbi:MAG: hypothetical protein KAJ39_07370 [Gammaproteobacteria bacterium]|nr:hypothetical protein [Gammaproteobacteria bacterium]